MLTLMAITQIENVIFMHQMQKCKQMIYSYIIVNVNVTVYRYRIHAVTPSPNPNHLTLGDNLSPLKQMLHICSTDTLKLI